MNEQSRRYFLRLTTIGIASLTGCGKSKELDTEKIAYLQNKPETNSNAKEDDYFARSQFLKMSDSEKLNAPPFEKFPAGVCVSNQVKLQIVIPKDIFIQICEIAKEQGVGIQYYIQTILCRLFSLNSA